MPRKQSPTWWFVGASVILAGGMIGYRWFTPRMAPRSPEPAARLITEPASAANDPSAATAAQWAASPGMAMGPVPATGNDASSEPGIFAGWSGWNEAKRNSALAPLVGGVDPDLDVIVFLRERLADRSLAPVTRNNIANVLIAHAADGALAARLEEMIKDSSESASWRDYALQHLARVARIANDPTATMRFIRGQVDHGSDSLPGTALLQVQSLEEAGLWKDREDLNVAVVTLAHSPRTMLANRMTAVAMIGSRNLSGEAAYLRQLIQSPNEPALVRTAIAALGQIGVSADVTLLQPYLGHADGSLVLAAKAAVERLQKVRL